MTISFNNLGKRFNKEWIFKSLNGNYKTNQSIAILGGNGSGKSTLLQLVAGNIQQSEGEIIYSNNKGEKISQEQIYKHITLCTPYLNLFEEYTLEETLRFHSKFKDLHLKEDEIIKLSYLENSKNKAIKFFSSGMKQRIKLALAILSKTEILLLDEPTSNLDKKGIAWYKELIREYSKNRIVFICSNNYEDEYFTCNEAINIEHFKN